jgi:hypothetical protein
LTTLRQLIAPRSAPDVCEDNCRPDLVGRARSDRSPSNSTATAWTARLRQSHASHHKASTGTYLPSQIAKCGPFANELNAEQYAEQPDRRYRETGPKIESHRYRNDTADQDPTPVWKRSFVRAKITFEMPSTMKYTSGRSVIARRPAPRWRIKSTPTITTARPKQAEARNVAPRARR